MQKAGCDNSQYYNLTKFGKLQCVFGRDLLVNPSVDHLSTHAFSARWKLGLKEQASTMATKACYIWLLRQLASSFSSNIELQSSGIPINPCFKQQIISCNFQGIKIDSAPMPSMRRIYLENLYSA
jgi:hypothetical protein